MAAKGSAAAKEAKGSALEMQVMTPALCRRPAVSDGCNHFDRRIWRRVDGDRGDRYGYDALGQVTDVKYDVLDPQTGTPTDWSRRVQYQWDPVGNRKKVTEDGLVTTYAANLVNQYTTVGGAALSYDGIRLRSATARQDGNLATAPAVAGPGGPWAYTYDAANRLIAAQSDAVRMEMVYDARNRCINRRTFQRLEGAWVASSDLWMGYDGWSLIEEGDALTGAIAAYVHGAQIDEILVRVDASGAVYYHADALGSTEFLTDAAGAVVERYRYDAFGQPTILDGNGTPLPLSALGSPLSALGNRFMFTGREWLSGLALYDYRHRVYSPTLGRWLQPDPIRFAAGDVNLYRYCGNSSVSSADPLGLCSELTDELTTKAAKHPVKVPRGFAIRNKVFRFDRQMFEAAIERMEREIKNHIEESLNDPGRPLVIPRHWWPHAGYDSEFASMPLVNLGGTLYLGSDVNYVAQGMLAARLGTGEGLVRARKLEIGEFPPRSPTLEMYRMGRNYYDNREKFTQKVKGMFGP